MTNCKPLSSRWDLSCKLAVAPGVSPLAIDGRPDGAYRNARWLFATLLLMALPPSSHAGPRVDVVLGPGAPKLEKFAAAELADQFKRLFDADVHISEKFSAAENVILLGSPATNPTMKFVAGDSWPKLSDQGHLLRSLKVGKVKVLFVGGGSPVATLWAVYELGHHFGIRYLLHGDHYPVKTPALKLDGIDQIYEPQLKLRAWRTIDSSPIGLESWGLADQKRLLHQLAKLKFNRVALSVHPWQPFVHYEFKGIKKQTALLFQGKRFPVEGDTPGRDAFRGAKEFENPDFAGKKTYEEKIKAGVALATGIIDYAHELGMTAVLTMPPMQFPDEFAAVLPDSKDLHDPKRHVVGLKLERAEDRARKVLDDPAWKALGQAQIKAYQGTYPKLDALHLTASDDDRVQILTLGDDNAMPQLGISQLYPQLKLAREFDWQGFLTRSTFPGEVDPSLYWLARAAFDTTLPPQKAYDRLFEPICGEGVSEVLAKGFGMIDQATTMLDKQDPTLSSPRPDVIMRHYQAKTAPPPWWKKALGLYSSATDEMYRAWQRAAGSRKMILYHAKRCEFAIHYFTCIEAVRNAGLARDKKDRDKQIEHLEAAVEALHNGLSALGEVARDQSDRGVIAVLNAYGYRPLKAELERVATKEPRTK